MSAPVTHLVSSQARHEPNSGGVPSSPSLALSSNSRASSTREDTGTAGVLPANAVPVQITTPWGKQPTRRDR